ncbi:MAG: acyl-CoA synthetase [Hyphomicrobiales bacterium]|nr:acyl-CoA synthetase [Hyphomicrobiales bacterium]MCP5372226.1 acyl-CoA synthetase [Hyphomicrobiales bacterium]
MTDQPHPRVATLADVAALEARPLADNLPARSVYGLIERAARLHGDRAAFTYLPDGDPATAPRQLSFAELRARVTQAANLFHSLGLGPDESVAILAPNTPSTQVAMWGAETAARACPINILLDADHVAELVRAARARVLVALGPDPDLPIWPRVEQVLARVEVAAVLVLGHDAPDVPGVRAFDTALDRQPADGLAFARTLDLDTPAALFHTGGTTGLPKLAQHTHGNQVHSAWAAALYYDLGPDDVVVNGFPVFHVAGSLVYGLSSLSAGARQVLPTRTGMRNTAFMGNFWKFAARERATVIAGVPTTLATLLKIPPDPGEADRVRVFLTGGSPLPSELAAAVEAAYGRPVRNIFGMTESAGLVTVEPFHGPRLPGSTGLRLPHGQVRAVALGPDGPDLDRPCAPGETGVIVLRGPNVGPGYTDPTRNAGTFTADGWLISGDLGHVDAEGRVFVTGRSKDVIIRGAHNIDPAAIEEALATHPAVEMCAAVGQPDAYAGELPVAYVTLKPGATATAGDLAMWAEPRIAEPPARPKRIAILDAMPLTAIGKIYKPELRRDAAAVAFDAALAPLRAAGAAVTVSAEDRAGSPFLFVAVDDPDRHGPAIRAALRDFVVPYEVVQG